jgi:hypothetical protein
MFIISRVLGCCTGKCYNSFKNGPNNVKFASLWQKCLRNTKIKKIISTQKIFVGNIKNGNKT